MRLLRWKTIVTLCASLILAWTAVDLLVPTLCAAESFTVSGESSQDSDESPLRPDSDCFCCSQAVSPMSYDVVFLVVSSVAAPVLLTVDLAVGVSRLLYHPPIQG